MRNVAPDTFYIRSPRLNQLLILKELAADPHLTQAELARRCELSVAMVNNYMKELNTLGWLEYHRRSTKSVSYHLTPAGHQQIDEVEAELVQEMVNRFVASKAQIRERVLARVPGMLRRVVLVGCGDLAEMAFHALESAQISVVGVCDFGSLNVGRDWCGRKVLDPSQILYLKPEAVVIADPPEPAEVYVNLKHLTAYGMQVICLGCRPAGRNGNRPAPDIDDPNVDPGQPLDLAQTTKLTH
jgi:DNA-binding MarR family transcriptional regulator